MHYHAEIYLEKLENVDEQIAEIMKPYDEGLEIERYEEDGEELWRNPRGFWDFWVIGGRWTGDHTGYDPWKDRLNYSKCRWCGGTGFRNDAVGQEEREIGPTYTCNSCGEYDLETKTWSHGEFGPGLSMAWIPRPYYGDLMHIAGIKDDLTCYTLIVNGKIYPKEHFDYENLTFLKNPEFDGNVMKKLNELGIKDGYLITVDYHC